MLLPYQRAQASLFTGVGGFGLSSTEARRMSVSVGSMMATVPEVLANLSGNIGEKARRGFPSRTSSAAFGGASGTSATCTEPRMMTWRTSSRKTGGTEPSEQEGKVPQNIQLRKG